MRAVIVCRIRIGSASGNGRDRLPNLGMKPGQRPGARETGMNITIISLVLLLPLAATARAQEIDTRVQHEPRTLEQVEAARPRAVVTVDCESANWPSLQAVAHYNGMSAFDPVAHVRHRIVIEGTRACRRGAEQVLVVFNAAERPVAIAAPGR